MNARRSFTLIEMMIALALVVALVLVLLPATSRIMSSTTAAADRGHRMAQVALLWDVLDRSLLTAMAQDAGGAPGVTGTSSRFRIASSGVSLAPREAGAPDDVQTIEIAFEAGTLVLREGAGPAQTLLTDVEACRFEYNSGDGWIQDYDGTAGLPRVVAVSVWLAQNELDEYAAVAEVEGEGFGDPFASDERTPDWRRVFAVFDPMAGAAAGTETP